MEAKAHAKYVRISPRKVRVIADLIRNKPVGQAMNIIKLSSKAACEPMEKLLKSAIANAENNHQMDASKLYVAQVFANPGPIL